MFAASGPSGPSDHRLQPCLARRGGRFARPVIRRRASILPGAASAPSCGGRSPTPPGTCGSSRSRVQRARRRRRSSSRPPTDPRAGSAVASARLLQACAARRARAAASQVDARRPAGRRAAASRPATAASPRPAPRTAARASTRATPSTSSSSATPTASPTPRRSRSPRCPASPTTRSSSAARPGLGKTHLLHSIAQLRAPPTATARPSATRPPRPSPNHFLGALHGRRHRRLQGRLPRRRRPARRRRPVPPGQGPHGAGVLPHLQRAPRRPARRSC